jgi:hypothetical protein
MEWPSQPKACIVDEHVHLVPSCLDPLSEARCCSGNCQILDLDMHRRTAPAKLLGKFLQSFLAARDNQQIVSARG